MKKIQLLWHFCLWKKYKKILMIMKLCCVFVFLLCLNLSATVSAQSEKISLDLENVSMERFLTELKKQTSYSFMYNSELVGKAGRVSVKVKKKMLSEVLTTVLRQVDFEYEFYNNVILIRPSTNVPEKKTPRKNIVRGEVKDETGLPLPGVTVVIKGSSVGVATDKDGKFEILLVKDTVTLVFTFVGMKTQHVKIGELKAGEERKALVIVMKEDKMVLEDVVVTGYANIRKSSFTGSATQVKREELLKVSTGNVIDALQVFDPSLRMIKNNEMGSDPNTLPEFYIRGRSGMEGVKQLDKIQSSDISEYALTNNPNLPIFIMDGYEVSIEKVYDMDPNRVETINILKDAAATAMYGSRASNGVIVIETVAPKPGQLRVAYNGTLGITAPDLSDYNLMNAREKLDAEVAAGLLDADSPLEPGTNDYANRVADYRNKLNNVLLGVDTYWLGKPLRTEVNHKHSLFVDGGVESVRYMLGLRYEGQNGVMKGSYRNKVGADLKLDSRIKSVQISNQVSYDVVRTQNSPYGTFYDYVKMQPYWKPTDENGELIQSYKRTYGTSGGTANPLYAATLNSYNRSSYQEITDNLQLNWYITKSLQFKAQLSLDWKEETSNVFTDPNHPIYNDIDLSGGTVSELDKGGLNYARKKTFGWNTNLLLMYNGVIGKYHNINLTLGANVKEDKTNYNQIRYIGFPLSGMSDRKFANRIDKETLQSNHTRLVGAFLQGNYTFNDIYLLDVSLRLDGSSEFGANNRFATFWSGGAGINVHNYAFMKAFPLITLLRVKANYGQTGKVNFPPFAARHTYEILSDSWHMTGIGTVLYYMGNDDLTWEKTKTLNLGLDINVAKRVNLELSWYNKRTVDLITDVSVPSSSGATVYKDNLGEVRNRGYEINLNVNAFQNKNWDVSTFVRLAHNKNKIMKISDALREYNDRVDSYYNDYDSGDDQYSKPVMKYQEGGSLTSIFGMKSLGISPANGNELFLYRDGKVSYTWKSSEQVIIGDTEPEVQGSFGLNLRYRNFTLYTTFLFELGGDTYNQTLVDQVECVNLWARNVDKRVSSARWQKEGDMTSLKSIKDRYNVTRSTSRFVEKNNTLNFNSLTLGYDFDKESLRRLGISMLRLSFNMKDVAVFSTVKQERGLSYPFARTFNFTLNVSF